MCALLDDVADRAPIMANRILALVRKMFNFAIEHDWLDTNPCQMVKRVTPERQRDRVLSEDEVRAVWKALNDERPMVAALFRLRLLTAQRGGELHGARWAEIDLKAGWWTIPATRAKNGLAHRVPLSPQAVRVLKTLRGNDSTAEYLFQAAARHGHISTMLKRRSSESQNVPALIFAGTIFAARRPA